MTKWNKDQNYTCERDKWISLSYPINDNSTRLIIIICCCCRAFGGSGNLRIPHWGGVYGCLLEYLPLIQELFEAKVSGLVMNDIAFFFFAGLCNLSGSESVQNLLILAGYSRPNH